MASIESKSMDTPDETRTPDKTMVSVGILVGHGRAVERSRGGGGRSASSLSSVARVARRRTSGYVVSGRLHIASNDGSELDLGLRDAYRLEPGHDAWVLGDDPFVALEFESKTAETYAKN